MNADFKNYFNLLLVLIAFLSPAISRAQWQNLGSGISSSPHTILSISAVNEDVIWAVSFNVATGVSYDYTVSLDGGNTWNAGMLSDSIGDFYPLSICALDAQTAWIVMINTPRQDIAKLYKTIDGGSSWQEQVGEFNEKGSAFATIHFFDENEGVGFGSPGTGIASVDSVRIYHTNNGGEDWIRVSNDAFPDLLPKEGVWIYGDNRYESKGDTLWFGTRASRVFRTTDRGVSWQAFSTGISGNSEYPGLASIAFQDSQNGIVTTYFPSQAARTTDGGETWTKIAMPATPRAADIEFVPGTSATYIINEGYQGTGSTGRILITHDQGQTWTSSTYSPLLRVIRFLSPSIGFGGGFLMGGPDQGGMYKWTGDYTTSTHEHFKIEKISDLFPNPVSDKLMIQLDPEFAIQSYLKLTIFDLFGSSVKHTIINSNLTEIDLNDLVEGVYIYKLSDCQNLLASGKIIKQ